MQFFFFLLEGSALNQGPSLACLKLRFTAVKRVSGLCDFQCLNILRVAVWNLGRKKHKVWCLFNIEGNQRLPDMKSTPFKLSRPQRKKSCLNTVIRSSWVRPLWPWPALAMQNKNLSENDCEFVAQHDSNWLNPPIYTGCMDSHSVQDIVYTNENMIVTTFRMTAVRYH